MNYWVEDHENGTLRANGTGGPPRIDKQPLIVAGAVTAKWEKHSGGPAGDECQNLVVGGIVSRYGKGTDSDATDGLVIAPTLLAPKPDRELDSQGRRQDGGRTDMIPIVRTFNVVPEGGQGADLRASETDLSLALSSLNGQSHDRVTLVAAAGVRRLTPLECERLQAWPDGWTNPTGEETDSRRYAACGDGVTATVGEWIGRRIIAADQTTPRDSGGQPQEGAAREVASVPHHRRGDSGDVRVAGVWRQPGKSDDPEGDLSGEGHTVVGVARGGGSP